VTKQQPSRSIPSDPELEQCVLGGIMLLPQQAFPLAAGILSAEMFWIEGHRAVFSAMGALMNRGVPPDVDAVRGELKTQGRLDVPVGGAGTLLSMINAVPTAANVEPHCRIVAELAYFRALIRASTQIIEECYRRELSLADVLAQAHSGIAQLSAGAVREPSEALADIIAETYAGIEQRAREVAELKREGKRHQLVRGIPSGLPDLDRLMRGLKARQLIIIAGATSMGKTALALELACHCAIERRLPAVVFSLEMGADELGERLLAMRTRHVRQDKLRGIPTDRFDAPDLTDADWQVLRRARAELSEAPLYLRCPGRLTVDDLRAALRSEQSEHQVQLAIVDHLGLMQADDSRQNRYGQVSQLSRGLKQVARELDMPLVVPHQLHRIGAERKNKRPLLSDLRDSGSVEQDADVVVGLYRKDYYERQEGRDLGTTGLPEAELIVLKNRNGPTGTAEAWWYEAITRFLPKARGA